MNKSAAPQIISLSTADLEKLLGELRGPLAPATYQLVEGLLRTLQWVMAALEEKTASLGRLRRMIFGAKTEKACKILPATIAAILSGPPKPKAKGHGRNGAKDYPAAQRVQVPHPQHKAGDLCPKCLKAKLYLFTTPARLVRIVAQPIFHATVFELERLRCALCGDLFTAPAPPEAGQGKYDPSVGPMLALLRFGAGVPMYRTDKWQDHFGVPLPASTQWELIEAASETPQVIYEALIGVAAQGQVLHNDDTHRCLGKGRKARCTPLRAELAARLSGEPLNYAASAIIESCRSRRNLRILSCRRGIGSEAA